MTIKFVGIFSTKFILIFIAIHSIIYHLVPKIKRTLNVLKIDRQKSRKI